jgi:SAP domain
MDKLNKLLLKLLKEKEKRDVSKRINTKQNKKQRKLKVEQFLPKVRATTKLEEQLQGVRRKRIMDLDYKKKLAEIKEQQERQVESIATPSVETLIKQEKRKAGRPKKVIDASALKQVKELYEMNVAELKEKARTEGIKTTQTKNVLIKQLQELSARKKEQQRQPEETFTPEMFKPSPVKKKTKEIQQIITPLIPIKQERKPLDKMTKTELQEEATYYGLKKTGNKPEIIDRINKHIELTPKTKPEEQTETRRKTPSKQTQGTSEPQGRAQWTSEPHVSDTRTSEPQGRAQWTYNETPETPELKPRNLFNQLAETVNRWIPQFGAFPREEIAQGYQEIAQDKAENDAYEAQERQEEANYVLPLKLVNNAKQGEIMDDLRQNDMDVVEANNSIAKKKSKANKKTLQERQEDLEIKKKQLAELMQGKQQGTPKRGKRGFNPGFS